MLQQRFETLVHEEGIALPLDHAAALIAAEEEPDLRPEDALVQLDALASGIYLPQDRSLYENLARINHYLFGEQGFRGEFDFNQEPESVLLHRVLEQRRGQPVRHRYARAPYRASRASCTRPSILRSCEQ